MITKLSVLFTIISGSRSYLVEVVASGCEDPPLPAGSNGQFLKEFVMNYINTHTEYPCLCTYDFGNIMLITIHHLLGWDEKKKENTIEYKKSIFGDLNAWWYIILCYRGAGKKNIALSIFVVCECVKNLENGLDGLGDTSTREAFSGMISKYAGKVMMISKQLHSIEELNCSCAVVHFRTCYIMSTFISTSN